jgi:hypothetical protein
MSFVDLSSFFFSAADVGARRIDRSHNVELALKRCALVSLSTRLGSLVGIMNRDACLALPGYPWLGSRPLYFLSSAGESYEHVALVIIYTWVVEEKSHRSDPLKSRYGTVCG